MKKVIFFLSIIVITTSCKPGKINQVKADNKDFAGLLDKYYDDRMHMFPLKATMNGDSALNNLLSADFSVSYYKKLTGLLNIYQISLNTFDRAQLNDDDKISFDILK